VFDVRLGLDMGSAVAHPRHCGVVLVMTETTVEKIRRLEIETAELRGKVAMCDELIQRIERLERKSHEPKPMVHLGRTAGGRHL